MSPPLGSSWWSTLAQPWCSSRLHLRARWYHMSALCYQLPIHQARLISYFKLLSIAWLLTSLKSCVTCYLPQLWPFKFLSLVNATPSYLTCNPQEIPLTFSSRYILLGQIARDTHRAWEQANFISPWTKSYQEGEKNSGLYTVSPISKNNRCFPKRQCSDFIQTYDKT